MLFLLIGLSIKDLQYTTDPSGDSPYLGSSVSVTGIVTAVLPDLRGFYIQDSAGAWSGIFVYAGVSMPSVSVGDSVLVSGVIQEYHGNTEIVLSSVSVLGSSTPFPSLRVLIPEVAESLEGVLIKVDGWVKDAWINRRGEYTITDGTNDLLALNRNALLYFPFVGDSFEIVGILDQRDDNYRLIPRWDGDITPLALRFYTPFFNKSTDTTLSRVVKNYGNDTLRFVVATFIEKARYSVDVAIYNLTSQTITDALIDAHERGVKVRVIYESENDNSYIAQLRSAGIPLLSDAVRTDYGYMHMKVVIVDARDPTPENDVVLVGSYNFTVYADTLQINNLTAIRSFTVAQNFLAEFNEMWGSSGDTPDPSNARFGVEKTPNTQTYFPDESIGVWFPPADTAEEAFRRFILATSIQIHFGINVFTHDGVRDAYRILHNSGRHIFGLFDYSDWNSSYSESQTMRTWGPPTEVHPYLSGYTFHDKFAIRDLSAVEFGSVNWTYNGFTRSDEVMVIINSRHFADQFVQYLGARWREATDSSLPLGLVEIPRKVQRCNDGVLYTASGRKVNDFKAKGIYFMKCGRKIQKILKM
ncbi:MAG: hypothetical protein GXO39_09055 [Thermotogae bacterium]|nr:hypothetical protein [Thermotogota bacterium]